MNSLIPIFSLVIFSFCFSWGEEGFWPLTLDKAPAISTEFKAMADTQWREHVIRSAAKIQDVAGDCSASFVSPNGLIITNQHCIQNCLARISTKFHNYLTDGFFSKALADELRCSEMAVYKLISITDVTSRLSKISRVKLASPVVNTEASVRSEIENECEQSAVNLKCDVVPLYRGQKYLLYKYVRYEDTRLVFAPEFAIALFGGDLDNFSFPRFSFDMAFLRVYENEKPASTPDYFKWSPSGPKANETTFVVGNPGATSRFKTTAELKFNLERIMVESLLYLSEYRGFLNEFFSKHLENNEIVEQKIFIIENSYKSLKSRVAALLDSKTIQQMLDREKAFKKKIGSKGKLHSQFGDIWKEVSDALIEYEKIVKEFTAIEKVRPGSHLYEVARQLVRAAQESVKPKEQKFSEFTDKKLVRLRRILTSDILECDDYETAAFTFQLSKLREALGPDHNLVKSLFGKRSPEDLAKELIKNSKLRDVRLREKLFDGQKAAIDESTDPLIRFCLLIEPEAQKVRNIFEDKVALRLNHANRKLEKALFEIYGDAHYPNSDSNLRISSGEIKGYSENVEVIIPFTDFSGLFDRHTSRPPYALPTSWLSSKSKLNMKTNFNFISTNDVVGGSSGSAVLNKKAEFVGLVFDGNMNSLAGDFIYDQSKSRAISLSSSAIIDSLKNIYFADRIVAEITSEK